MYTRKDYINGLCTHEQYYSQFVNDGVLRVVAQEIGIERIKEAYKTDKHLNNISLYVWDRVGLCINPEKKFLELGDSKSLAGLVCIVKEAARQLIKKEGVYENSNI